jgi:hypothetical protein
LDKLHHADLSGLSSGALGNPGTLEDVSADIRMRFWLTRMCGRTEN